MDGWITYKIMKAQFLEISGHKNEKSFYKEFPTMDAFMAKHGPALKKAQSGSQIDNNGNGIPDYLENMTPANYNQQFAVRGPTQYNQAPQGNSSDTMNTLGNVASSAVSNSGTGQGLGGTMKGMFSGGDAGNGGFSNIGKSFGFGGGSGAAGAASGGGGGIMKSLGGIMGGSSGGGGGASNAGSYVQAAISVGQGVAELKKEKDIKRKARSDRDVVKVVRQAYDSEDVNQRQDYMDNAKRTRDALVPTVDASALFPTYGTGTNSLGYARSGGEITNTYAPNTLYDDLGYEPLEESAVYKPVTDNEVVKNYRYGGRLYAQNGNNYGQMANNAVNQLGQNNQMMALGNTYSQSTSISKTNNAGGKIGGGIGMAVGTYFGGPLGGMVGKWAGTQIGGALDSNYKKIQGFNYQKEQDVNYMKNSTGLQNVRASNFGAYTEDGGVMYRTGGNLRQNSGDIQALSGGHLEPVSYNPYSDGDGITSMVKGQTHEESNGRHSGVLLSYNKGQNGASMEADVEAENNEPVTEIGDSAVIFGNIVINDKTVGDDPMFKNLHGKTFKKAMAGIAEQNQKLNKQQAKNTQALNSLDPKTPIDKLKFNSLAITAKAIDTKYALNDAIMKKAAAHQEIVNQEAHRLGINSGDFSRGKLSPEENDVAKNGKKVKPRPKLEPVNQITPRGFDVKPYPLPTANVDFNDRFVDSSAPANYSGEPKYEVTPYNNTLGTLQTLAGQVLPWFRDQPGENLQNDQIAGELNALSDNDVDPVQARFYRPNLRTPYDISYQDQLNQNQADFNQMLHASADNPEALAALAAQKYQANSRVLGEQFRQNQANKEAVYSQNTAILNDALGKNLQIADQQYVRQAQAKSATKAVRQEALSSIASKVAQNRLENRTLQTYANMFPDYSFDSSYRAQKTGAPAQFNIDQGIYDPKGKANQAPIYDANGVIIGYKPIAPIATQRKEAVDDAKKGKYGALVKAFKNI